jgi:hypothetical protein
MTIKVVITNDDPRGENAIVKVRNINPDGSSKDKDPRTNYSNAWELKGEQSVEMWVSSDSPIIIEEVKNG